MGDAPFAPTAVAPIGTHRTAGFVCPGGYREWDAPTYPPSPHGETLSELMVALDMGLRDACRVTGLSPVVLSGLRHRRYTLPDAEWLRLFGVLVAEWRRRHPPVSLDAFGGGVSNG